MAVAALCLSVFIVSRSNRRPLRLRWAVLVAKTSTLRSNRDPYDDGEPSFDFEPEKFLRCTQSLTQTHTMCVQATHHIASHHDTLIHHHPSPSIIIMHLSHFHLPSEDHQSHHARIPSSNQLLTQCPHVTSNFLRQTSHQLAFRPLIRSSHEHCQTVGR